jgi:hypothetical protein
MSADWRIHIPADDGRHRTTLNDSASSTKAPEAGIREDCDELANDRKGRSTACYFAFVIGKS